MVCIPSLVEGARNNEAYCVPYETNRQLPVPTHRQVLSKSGFLFLPASFWIAWACSSFFTCVVVWIFFFLCNSNLLGHVQIRYHIYLGVSTSYILCCKVFVFKSVKFIQSRGWIINKCSGARAGKPNKVSSVCSVTGRHMVIKALLTNMFRNLNKNTCRRRD